MLTLHTLFVVLALICFIAAAFNAAVKHVSIGWLGLAFLCASLFFV